MNTARQILFTLTRQRFSDTHRERVEALCAHARIDWAAVSATAGREGVAPIVGVNLAACDPAATRVPQAVTDRLQGALFENAARKAERWQDLEAIVADLRHTGWDVLLLKSAALDACGVYRDRWVTCARDADILLRRRRGAGAATDPRSVRSLLDRHGIETDLLLPGDTPDRAGHHDLSLNGIVRLSVDDLWQGAREVPLGGTPGAAAWLMCPEDLLLTLCLNGCRKRYFRLKTLFDIAETVACHPDLDWTRLARRARAWGVEALAFAAIRAAAVTLGLPSWSRAGYSVLAPGPRRLLLESLVRAVRSSEPRRRFPLILLQYAGFGTAQAWRSLRLALARRATERAPLMSAEALLPGE